MDYWDKSFARGWRSNKGPYYWQGGASNIETLKESGDKEL